MLCSWPVESETRSTFIAAHSRHIDCNPAHTGRPIIEFMVTICSCNPFVCMESSVPLRHGRTSSAGACCRSISLLVHSLRSSRTITGAERASGTARCMRR